MKLSSGLALLVALAAGVLSANETENLLTNPGFETGTMDGWDITGDVQASLDNEIPAGIHSGTYAARLSVSNMVPVGAWQTVNLSTWAAEIDSGDVRVRVGGQLAKDLAQTATFTFWLLDATDQTLATDTFHATQATYSLAAFTNTVPAGTRSIKVEVFVDSIFPCKAACDDLFVHLINVDQRPLCAGFARNGSSLLFSATNLMIGTAYTVVEATNLPAASWHSVTGFVATGSETNCLLPIGGTQRFYRITTSGD